MLSKQPDCTGDGEDGRVQGRSDVVQRHQARLVFRYLSAIRRVVEHLRPSARLQLASNTLGERIVHGLLHGVEGFERSPVHGAKSVEGGRCPLQHPFAPLLRQADGMGDDRDGQVLREFGGGVESAFGYEPVHERLGLGADGVVDSVVSMGRPRLRQRPGAGALILARRDV